MRTSPNRFRIFIDESGIADLSSSDDPNNRFLSLTGVIIGSEHNSAIVFPQLEVFKRKHFGDYPDAAPIVLHRSDILNANHPFGCLKDQTKRAAFDKDWLKHLTDWRYVVITVCLDKKAHREKYIWAHDAYHYCLEMMLERYVLFLRNSDGIGDVMAESRGGHHDRRLKNAYTQLWEKGNSYHSAQEFQRRLSSKQLKVETKKDNIAGLQIADLIAHPSRNDVLRSKGILKGSAKPFAQKVNEVLAIKYLSHRGYVDGYGKKFR